jgi:hypothetical protein
MTVLSPPSASTKRRRGIAALFIGVPALSVLAPVASASQASASPSPGGPASSVAFASRLSPTSLLQKAEIDAVEAGWAHVTVAEKGVGTAAVYDEVVGSTSGTQQLSVNGGQVQEAVLLGGVAYFKDDTPLLMDLGLSRQKASKLANRWVSVPKGDKLYSTLAAGMTVAGVLEGALPSGRLSFGRSAKVRGVDEVSVDGDLPLGDGKGSATVWVSLGDNPAVVQTWDKFQGGAGPMATFAKWGVAARVDVPSSAIPAGSVGL